MCTSRGKIWLRVINRGITAIYVCRGNGQGPFQAPKSEVIYYKGYGKGIRFHNMLSMVQSLHFRILKSQQDALYDLDR